jgi:Ca-activated chloride channel family protein
LTYNLLTRYTSFIAVHEIIRNPERNGKDVQQPLPLPLHVSDLAVGGMKSVPEPGLTALLMAIGFLAIAGLSTRKRKEATSSIRSH